MLVGQELEIECSGKRWVALGGQGEKIVGCRWVSSVKWTGSGERELSGSG